MALCNPQARASERLSLDQVLARGLDLVQELALRRAAQAVDAQMLDYLRTHALAGTWAASERLVVAVSELPGSAELVRAAKRIADRAIQVLGGYGYVGEYRVERLWRDAKLYEIGAGTSEIRRMLIGRELFAETL